MPRKDCLYSRLFGEAFVQNRTLPKAPFDRHAQNTPIVRKTRQKIRKMTRARETTCTGMWRGSPMTNQGDGNICSPSKPSSIKECEHLRAKAVAQLWAPGAYLQCGVTPWSRSVWKESRWQHFRPHEAEGHRRLNLPVVFADPTQARTNKWGLVR